jgi:hypothetical protein
VACKTWWLAFYRKKRHREVDPRTFLTTNTALVSRLVRTFSSWMAFLLTDTAFASEGTGYLRIGAISFVVSNFTTVEALSG